MARRPNALVMNNGHAPRGYVEIQRDDDAHDIGSNFECDEDAAEAVVQYANLPGTVACWKTGQWFPLDERPELSSIVVPAVAAWRAGLCSWGRMAESFVDFESENMVVDRPVRSLPTPGVFVTTAEDVTPPPPLRMTQARTEFPWAQIDDPSVRDPRPIRSVPHVLIEPVRAAIQSGTEMYVILDGFNSWRGSDYRTYIDVIGFAPHRDPRPEFVMEPGRAYTLTVLGARSDDEVYVGPVLIADLKRYYVAVSPDGSLQVVLLMFDANGQPSR